MSSTSGTAKALEIFFSYAHEDRTFLDAITKQLSPLKRQGLIANWSDCNISAGNLWRSTVEQYINIADIILLLVSPDFIVSEYCYSLEMRQAMERHERGEARVIPIILRPVDWLGLPFGTLKPLPEGGRAVTLWQTKDSALFDIAKGIRKVVEEFAIKLLGGSPPSTDTSPKGERSLPPFWNVPYRRNPFFTGREIILTTLHQAFLNEEITMRSTQALSGLGGIGKTQIAVEYAYRYQSDYQAILWVNADSRNDLISEMIKLADVLKLPERREQDQAQVIAAVKHWLQNHRQWLLTFDNIEELDAVNDFLPQVHSGHIMMTTRSQATGPVAHSIPIEKMNEEEGTLLLLRRAKIILEGALLNEASGTEVMNARKISQTIDGLPLALDQAGAYIEENQQNLLNYLNLYRKRRTNLLKRRGRFFIDHPQSVLTTLSLSIEKVEQANPAAVELLRLCAFLHSEAIPEELFTEGSPDLGPVLQPVTGDPLELDSAIEELLKFSLLRRNTDTKTLNLHRLVQVVVKDVLSENEQYQWADRAVRIVNRVFPDVEFTTWTLCQRYLPHAQVCIELIQQWKIETRESVRLLYQVGEYLRERVLYAQAEVFLMQALEISERIFGLEDHDTANSLNNMAGLYFSLGKYKEAEPLYQRAMAIREQVLGPEHPDTAQSLNNLAHLYRIQSKLSLAKSHYERALAIREKVLGKEHSDTAQSLNNLAFLYRTLNDLKQAESLYEQALRIRSRILGTEHPETTNTLNNLARLYHVLGKYKEAEPLYQQLLFIREQILGPEDPSTAIALNNLGLLYRVQGKYQEAEPLYQRALTIRKKVLGIEHPDTAQSLNNLAFLYCTLGKYQEAEPLYQEALTIREKVLEAEHPDIAQTLSNLGDLYRIQGQYNHAEELLNRALTIREQKLGAEHLDVAIVLNNIATLYCVQGKYKEAESLYQRALAIREKKLQSAHPDIAQILANMAELHQQQHNYTEAKSFYERALLTFEKALGPEHPNVAKVRNSYTVFLREKNTDEEESSI